MSVQRYYVYPEQFSPERPAVHALQRLSADIDGVLEAKIPEDVKQRLFQNVFNRYLSVLRSDEQRKAGVYDGAPTPAAVHTTPQMARMLTPPPQASQQAQPHTPVVRDESDVEMDAPTDRSEW